MGKTPNRVIIINVLCTALLNGISMIMMPVYSHLLGTDNYGLSSIYTTWSTIFSIIIGLQLASSIAVAQKDFSKEEQLAYQANGVYIGAIMGFAMSLICAAFRNPISSALGIPAWSVLLLCPHAFGLFCVNFLNSKFTYEFKQEKNLLISVSMSLGAAALSVVTILLLPDEASYFGKVIGAAIPQILCGLLLLIFFLRNIGAHINKVYTRYALAYGLPLVFSNLCSQLFASSDKLMIQRMQSNSAVGIYSLAFNFSAVVSSIWYALNSAWGPFYYRYEADGDDSVLLDHMKNFVRLFSIITAGFLLLSPEVFRLFAAPDFWSGDILIPVFVVGFYANFIGCFARNHQYYYKKTKTISAISIDSAVLNLILNAVLIPVSGAFGAAFATMMSQVISMFANWFTARRYASTARKFPYSCKMFFPYVGLLIIAVVLFYQKQLWWLRWPLGAVLGVWILHKLWKTKQIF